MTSGKKENQNVEMSKPIQYERLFEIAKAMHCWIFLNTRDEQKAYEEIGLSEEENNIFGYLGGITFSVRKSK